MINVDKQYLVIIKGHNVDKEDSMNHAEAVDYIGLKLIKRLHASF